MYLIIVCRMFVWCRLCLSVLNALLMSRATLNVRSGGLFWLKPVAMVLFMLCSTVLVEWLLLKPCCVEMCGMLFVMYGSSVFSSVFAITERVRWVCMRCLRFSIVRHWGWTLLHYSVIFLELNNRI